MPIYHCKVEGLTTGTTVGTFKTLVGLKLADTAGHRARLRRLILAGGGSAAQDIQVSARIAKTDNTTDGTSTSVNTNTIGQSDDNDIASNVSAIGKNYSVEPTTIGTGLLGGGSFNTRGGLVLEWNHDEAPIWGKNETLLIQGSPGETTAANLEAYVEWEE